MFTSSGPHLSASEQFAQFQHRCCCPRGLKSLMLLPSDHMLWSRQHQYSSVALLEPNKADPTQLLTGVYGRPPHSYEHNNIRTADGDSSKNGVPPRRALAGMAAMRCAGTLLVCCRLISGWDWSMYRRMRLVIGIGTIPSQNVERVRKFEREHLIPSRPQHMI